MQAKPIRHIIFTFTAYFSFYRPPRRALKAKYYSLDCRDEGETSEAFSSESLCHGVYLPEDGRHLVAILKARSLDKMGRCALLSAGLR